MQAWALLIEYDGSNYSGWQRQGERPTIQLVLENAAAELTGGSKVLAVGAGRTDAGVHAGGQVAMLSLPSGLSARTVREALNYHLRPHPVVILRAALAPANWNPRFSAIGRSYCYRILNRRPRPALDLGRVWHVDRPLEVDAMQAGAAMLLGLHDFSSFRATSCQAKSPIRTLDLLDARRQGDIIEIVAAARSFLHHQVRNMVGTLKLVGEGRWQPTDVAAALADRDRRAAGPTAPPQGLCLTHIRYTEDPFAPDGPIKEADLRRHG